MIKRTLTIARKELIHIIRDHRTLVVLFLIPVVQLFLLAYAASSDVEHLRTVVLDADRTPQSRELIEAYRASSYFNIVSAVANEEELAQAIDSGTARAGLVIPPGYGADVIAGRTVHIAFVIDGSDPVIAQTAFAAAQSVGQIHGVRIIERRLGIATEQMSFLEVQPRVWYNPAMKSVNFMVPALIAAIVFVLTMVMTGLTIVQEREWGTIEQLMVTPIRPAELVAGKVMPYVMISFIQILEILVFGVFWFRVPINGSVALLLGLSALFLVTSLGLGIFISSVASTFHQAMFVVAFILLPALFLSGFIYPLDAMPLPLQLISYLNPLRYMLVIVRGIMLKGVGLEVLMEQVIALVVFGVAIMTFAATRFRKRLG
ncbi:MAG: ABC transporter permease [Anaerolineae bacterium]|nr:ABC transporter permease [Anaerolineae bacterium]